MSLVSMAMNYFAPAIIDKIAASLGISSSVARMAIGAIVPSLLAGMAGKASQPGGGGVLADLLGSQDGGLLDNLGDLIGGDKQADIAQQGMGSLGSILGGSGLEALTGALGKFTGADATASSGMLGLAAPVLMGVLGKQQQEQGIGADGLAGLLNGQKDEVARAMPDGFAKLLDGSGVLDSIGPNLAALNATPQSRPEPVQTQTTADGGSTNWLPWAAGIALAALAGWYALGSGSQTAAIPETPKIMVGDKDIGSQFGGMMDKLRGTLGGIKDVDTAKAALPQLKTAQTEIDRLHGMVGKLPPADKKGFSAFVAKWLPIITPMIKSLADNSAVGPIIKPLIGPITTKLAEMAK